MQPFIYPGAIHIHTEFSHDCTGTIPHIVAAAREAGLRWIILTDHDNLEAQSYQGWHDNVLVIVGHEITPQRNHFLALGTHHVVDKSQHPQDFIDEVYAQGGFGIIAHPDDRVLSSIKKHYYAWEDWTIDGPHVRTSHTVGIELWNFMSDWGSHLTHFNKFVNFYFPRRGMHGPTHKTLAWWDKLNVAGKRTFGIAGVDAHAMKHRMPWGRSVEIFPYRWTFGTLTNYILLKERLHTDAQQAQQQIFSALMQGHCHFLNRLDGEAPHFTFVANHRTTQWHIGDSPTLEEGPLTLTADVGYNRHVVLLHNGQPCQRSIRRLDYEVQTPGVYRLESYHRSGRPWLFTNPLYVSDTKRNKRIKKGT